MTQPLVSCICPTTESRVGKWFDHAVGCFTSQDYPNLELVVLADTEHHGVTKAMVFGRELTVICGAWRTLGDKRNAACAAARGEIIAHWDTDDHSEPTRISHQIKALADSGKAVTGFKSMKFVDEGGAWYQYVGGPGYVLGTSLFYRRDWWETHRFVAENTSEDRAFCSAAVRGGKLHSEEDLGLMYATTHQGNTSPRDMSNPHLRSTWKPLPGFVWKGSK